MSSHPVALGQSLEDVQLQPLDRNVAPITLHQLRGKVTLINLWGPWCMYCRVEMPHLNALQQRLLDREDFAFLSVSCSPAPQTENLGELREETADYVQEQDYSFQPYFDPSGQLRRTLAKVAQHDQIAYPLTVLLDRNGLIRGYWMGSADGLDQVVAAAVERELSPSAPR